MGTYSFFFKSEDLISGISNTAEKFDLTLQANALGLVYNPIQKTIVYNILPSNTPLTISLPTYNSAFPESLSYRLVFVSFDPARARRMQMFPSFIQEFPVREIVIQTDDMSLAGTYNFELIATDSFSEV